MGINKENVQKAIDFLKTLAPESFIANQQTKDFSPENVGKSHCVYGHLVVNPSSPFFDEEKLNEDKTSVWYHSGKDFAGDLCYATGKIGRVLHDVNNEASDETRKQEVIEHLEKFYDTLEA